MNVVAAITRASLALALVVSSLSAQAISFGLRGTGSFPTGDFAAAPGAATSASVQGAKQGFGYGAELAFSVGPIGAYGSFDHIAFDCQSNTCPTNGEYTLQGVTLGAKLSSMRLPRVHPYVKAGVTFNELKGTYGGAANGELTSERAPGYELGAGADLGIWGVLALQPQVRYVGQNLKARVPGVIVTSTVPASGVNYFTFDLGLALHGPFGI